MRGRVIKNCHMFSSDPRDVVELHKIALAIGLKAWFFQEHSSYPHYDLSSRMRDAAIRAGAIPISKKESILIRQKGRQLANPNRSLNQWQEARKTK